MSGIEGRSCVMDTPTERFGQMLEQIWHQDQQRTDEGGVPQGIGADLVEKDLIPRATSA